MLQACYLVSPEARQKNRNIFIWGKKTIPHSKNGHQKKSDEIRIQGSSNYAKQHCNTSERYNDVRFDGEAKKEGSHQPEPSESNKSLNMWSEFAAHHEGRGGGASNHEGRGGGCFVGGPGG